MKTRNYIAVVITLVVNMFAFAANAQDAAILAGIGNSKGCFHYAVFDGVFQMQNCNGWTVAPVVTYSHVSYKSSESSSTSAMKFGAQVGYRHNMWRPEVYATYTPSMTIEGCKFNALEVGAALNIDFNRHSKINFFAAPTIAYKRVECHEELIGENVKLNIPYSGNVLMMGAKVGTMIKLGTIAQSKQAVVNGKKITYKNHSQHYLKIEAGYQRGSITEPGASKLTLNEVYASASWLLKF